MSFSLRNYQRCLSLVGAGLAGIAGSVIGGCAPQEKPPATPPKLPPPIQAAPPAGGGAADRYRQLMGPGANKAPVAPSQNAGQ